MGLLDGKVAFITGAARGQGRSHALALAGEGADIVAFDVCAKVGPTTYPAATPDDLDHTAKLVAETGRAVVAVQGDVRRSEDLAGAVARAVDELGGIDVVVANAGILSWDRFWELSDEAWDTLIDVNLSGVWRTLKAVAPPMIAAGRGGSIIVTSSVAGLKALPGQAHYVAAKHGLVGLVKAAALELGRHRIRVNSIHPWGVDTPMVADPDVGRIFDLDPEYRHAFRSMLTEMPFAPPEDISAAVVWLASPLSRTVTGAQFPLDMGASKV